MGEVTGQEEGHGISERVVESEWRNEYRRRELGRVSGNSGHGGVGPGGAVDRSSLRIPPPLRPAADDRSDDRDRMIEAVTNATAGAIGGDGASTPLVGT